jgi:hypothetical protein
MIMTSLFGESVMNTRSFYIIVSILFMAYLSSCGVDSPVSDISLSGTVDVEEIINDINGPILVAITNSDDFDKIENDPLNTIIDIRAIDEVNYSFDIDLSNSRLKKDDEVYIFAFVDNDYADGIPNPTEGDFIGFYIDPVMMSLMYRLKSGLNSGINIKINRRIFSFDAEISGTITGSDVGDLILIAYAGAIDSMDFTHLDFDGVVGYKRYTKNESPLPYTMKIFPYGYNVPIEKVYIIAILDKNRNGIDAGDLIGFYTENENHLPTLLTINEGCLSNKNIGMVMEIPQPSGYGISVEGIFEKPAGYDVNSKPVYIIIAQADDPAVLFEDPLSAIKYFQKVPAGENGFNIDLSKTDLFPNDEVFVIALWDRDYYAGFPFPSEGDIIGYLQNKDDLAFTIILQDGENVIPSGGYEFKINKNFYSHTSSIIFQLEEGEVNGNYASGDRVIVIAVQGDGFNILSNEIDMDYIIGTTTVEIDFDIFHRIPISPAIYQDIDVYNPFAIDNVYLFAVLDNNEANGKPDEGEYLGFYYGQILLFPIPPIYLYFPKTFDLSDGENSLPQNLFGNNKVRFSQTY